MEANRQNMRSTEKITNNNKTKNKTTLEVRDNDFYIKTINLIYKLYSD